ncbi:hypothetical protein [Devosia sp.]|uniref:hypothetical protein n=1 Tax=Devosia sp. TaxID=1871048 RepID=UPI003A911980
MLWLAASDGRRLRQPSRPISHLDAPERVMKVRFEGIDESQQRAALAAFPGGGRFVLSN